MQYKSAIQILSSSSETISLPSLLLVDDDRIIRMVMQEMLQRQGYQVTVAADSKEALTLLGDPGRKVDTIILDREMPGMNGLQVVAHLKADPKLSSIPIIMLTGSGEQEQIQEGINAGVFYYLVKPADNTLLRTIIDSALRERKQKVALISELVHHSSALKAMRSCQIAVQTLTEAEDTACFLASCFPEPERVVSGLMELMVNAIEHGNLGITYEEKQQLLLDNTWGNELERRSKLPENINKTAEVTYQHKDKNHLVRITDTGKGFDWKRYWHINPARATTSHGRGIVRARLMACDRMAYNDAGNQVTLVVSETPGQQSDYAW